MQPALSAIHNFFKNLSSFHLSYNGLECFGMIHGQISQHLAVDFDPGLVQRTHQLRIRHAFQTGSSIDTLNPQSTEVSLLILTVTERRCQTLFPRILGNGPLVNFRIFFLLALEAT